MKPIKFSRRFEKNYKRRVLNDKKLSKQFDERYEAFSNGARGHPLKDHLLKGTMTGRRAFSVANDLRVVYEETPEAYIFLDIGSHNQVYK
jgi:mRNA-degrading endonuclease YafQ of YafQ-DinJ toxin-antitoxin module